MSGDRQSGICPDSIVIVVTNPLDAMAQAMHHATGFPGSASLAWQEFLTLPGFEPSSLRSWEFRCKMSPHSCWGHGNQMVPLARYSTVAGVPFPNCCPTSGSTNWRSEPPQVVRKSLTY
jgi:malate dehydrogenase